MALDFAVGVFAVLVLGSVAVLAAGVRQHEGIVVRLLKATAVTVVNGHFVLGVAELAVGTGPVEEGQEPLGALFEFLLFGLFVALVHDHASLLLFFFVFLDVLLQTLVKLLNPTLDASKMERLAALLAVPKSTALVDRIVANHALLRPLSQRLDQKDALLRQVLKLLQEVFEVVLNFCFVLRVEVITSADELHFLLTLDLRLAIVVDVLGSCTQVIVGPLALARVVLAASLTCSTHLCHARSIRDCDFLLINDLVGVLVISVSFSLLLVKVVALLLPFSSGRPTFIVSLALVLVPVSATSTTATSLVVAIVLVLSANTVREPVTSTTTTSLVVPIV